MLNTLDREHEFYLDKDASGAAMRDQAIKFANLLSFWNERLGEFESARKTLQTILEQSRDKARCVRALEASERGYKAAIQDAYIRNIHDVIVDMGEELLSPSQIQQQLNETQEKEIEARVNVEVLRTAVDIARSALSWDRQESQQMPQ